MTEEEIQNKVHNALVKIGKEEKHLFISLLLYDCLNTEKIVTMRYFCFLLLKV
jgi:hypothetical protein